MSLGLMLLVTVLGHPDLDEGRVAVSAMKYRAAVPALTRVTQDAKASEPEVVEAFGLLAKAQLGLQKPELAQAAFEGLLQRAPMAEEPQGSPALRSAFQRAKSALFPPRTVRLVKRPSGAGALVVDVINPWRLPLTASWHAVRPDAPPQSLTIEEHRIVTGLAPGSAGWLELAAEGQVVAALGSRAAPLEGPPLSVADAPPTSDVPAKEPTLTPAVAREEPLLPPAPAKAPNASRRVLGWSLVGLGVAGTLGGIGLFGGGLLLSDRAENWATNGSTFEQSERDQATGGALQVTGPIVGGVGLAALVTGVVVLLTE